MGKNSYKTFENICPICWESFKNRKKLRKHLREAKHPLGNPSSRDGLPLLPIYPNIVKWAKIDLNPPLVVIMYDSLCHPVAYSYIGRKLEVEALERKLGRKLKAFVDYPMYKYPENTKIVNPKNGDIK